MTDSNSNSALMNDPGALFANIPGTLGFYPEESIVILCLNLVDEESSRYQLNQVFRVDIDDIAHLISLPGSASDLLFALVISRESPAAEQITGIVEILHHRTHLTIEAIWHAPSITEGEQLTLLSGEQVIDNKAEWVFGVVPSIFYAPATQESLRQGQIMDLNREESASRFDRRWLLPEQCESLAKAVQLRLRVLESYKPDAVNGAIMELRALLEATPVISRTGRGSGVDTEQLGLILALFDESHPELRDLAMWEMLEHPETGSVLTLDAARYAKSSSTRANALCVYFLVTSVMGTTSRSSLALNAAHHEAPEHTLTRLLAVAHARGETSNIVTIIKRGVDISRAKYDIL